MGQCIRMKAGGGNRRLLDGEVYIGRPGKWGNPFYVKDCGRKNAVAKYIEWLKGNPALVRAMKQELEGKRVRCWCTDEVCHGDVIVAIVNGDLDLSVDGGVVRDGGILVVKNKYR